MSKSETISKPVKVKERQKSEQWLRLFDFQISNSVCFAFRYSNFEFFPSFAFPQDRRKDVHQFAGFRNKASALLVQPQSTSAIEQTKPICRLFGFLSTGLDAQQEVLFANRLVRLDIIGAHRSRGSNKLFDILEIPDRTRKLLYETPSFLREKKRALLQVIRSTIRRFRFFLHFTYSNSICFGFRYSNFEFSFL